MNKVPNPVVPVLQTVDPADRFKEPRDEMYRIHGVSPAMLLVRWAVSPKTKVPLYHQFPDIDGRGEQ